MENAATSAPAAPPPRKRDWARAWTALRVLIADSERTDQVFEIIEALAGSSFERFVPAIQL